MTTKKIITLLLALVMVFALAACGNSDAEDSKQDSEPESTAENSAVTRNEAVQIAREYIENGYGAQRLVKRAHRRNDDINAISSPAIGSVSNVIRSESQGDAVYNVYVKGTFTAYDDYGQVVDRYKYTFTVVVKEEDGSVIDTTDREDIVHHIRLISVS